MMGSAHGKVILLGEHAVVYGVPALVVGIDRGATAHVSSKTETPEGPSELVLSASDGQKHANHLTVTSEQPSDVARAFQALGRWHDALPPY